MSSYNKKQFYKESKLFILNILENFFLLRKNLFTNVFIQNIIKIFHKFWILHEKDIEIISNLNKSLYDFQHLKTSFQNFPTIVQKSFLNNENYSELYSYFNESNLFFYLFIKF